MSSRGILTAVALSGNFAFLLLFVVPDVAAAIFGPVGRPSSVDEVYSALPTQFVGVLVMAGLGIVSFFLLGESRAARVGLLLLFLGPLLIGISCLAVLTFNSL